MTTRPRPTAARDYHTDVMREEHARTSVDNAVTAAFREVVGFCPIRDWDGEPAGTAMPKEIVRYDIIWGVVHGN